MTKKHEFLKIDDFYETRSVGTRARSDKHCSHCGKTIVKGTPHEMAHFYPEFESEALHKECVDPFMESLLTEEEYNERNP